MRLTPSPSAASCTAVPLPAAILGGRDLDLSLNGRKHIEARPNQAKQLAMFHLHHLTPELIDCIFTHLVTFRDSLRSIRLVCRGLCQIASPLLFSSVTIAKRRRSLRSAIHIMEHDVLRECIHTLVYDASTYTILDRESFDDHQDIEDCLAFRKSSCVCRMPGSDKLRDQMLMDAAFQHHCAAAKTEAWLNEEGLVKTALTMGLKLPRIKHIVFSDYRYLAQPGESVLDLWDRLFGSSPPPRATSEPTCYAEEELSDLLLLADELHVEVESFDCGENPYALKALPSFERNFMDPCGLPLNSLEILSGASTTRNLTRLSLVVYLEHVPAASSDTACLHQVLQSCSASLKELTLHLLSYMGSVGRAKPDNNENFPLVLVNGQSCLRFFHLAFSGILFSKLRILDLGGIPFYQHDMRDFLRSQTPSLDHLCLRYCFYNEGSGKRLRDACEGEQSHSNLCNLIAACIRLKTVVFSSVTGSKNLDRDYERIALGNSQNNTLETV